VWSIGAVAKEKSRQDHQIETASFIFNHLGHLSQKDYQFRIKTTIFLPISHKNNDFLTISCEICILLTKQYQKREKQTGRFNFTAQSAFPFEWLRLLSQSQ
jgi:hypothetical protein